MHVARRVEGQAIARRHHAYPLGQLLHGDFFVDAERDVFRHGQGIEQGEMLKHHADAESPRLGRRCNLDRLAPPQNVASIGPKHAIDDFHQGRFTGPVSPSSA